MSGLCPKCGYKIYKARCFNCDYKERGSDGPWSENETDQGLIRKAEGIWDEAWLLSSSEHSWTDVPNYLARRRIAELALTCDQLRHKSGLHRVLPIHSGSVLLARIWHVHKGFVGIHATHIWSDLVRGDRTTCGACRGGGVWFGTVTPVGKLVAGEGIETVLIPPP
jgi:hypothetical protein